MYLVRINISFSSSNDTTIAGGVCEEDPLDDADAGAFGIIGLGRWTKKEEKKRRRGKMTLCVSREKDLFYTWPLKWPFLFAKVSLFARNTSKRKQGKVDVLTFRYNSNTDTERKPNVHELLG